MAWCSAEFRITLETSLAYRSFASGWLSQAYLGLDPILRSRHTYRCSHPQVHKKTVSTVCHVRSKPFLHQDLGNRRKGLSIQRFSSHDCRRDGRHHRRSNARPEATSTCGARPGLWPGLALEHAWAWQEGDAKSEMRGFGAFSQAAFLRDLDRHLSPAALEATQLRALGAAK